MHPSPRPALTTAAPNWFFIQTGGFPEGEKGPWFRRVAAWQNTIGLVSLPLGYEGDPRASCVLSVSPTLPGFYCHLEDFPKAYREIYERQKEAVSGP